MSDILLCCIIENTGKTSPSLKPSIIIWKVFFINKFLNAIYQSTTIIPEIYGWIYTQHNLMNVTQHNDWLEGRSHMISLNTDKVFKKSSTYFHDKSHGQSRDIWDLYKHNKGNKQKFHSQHYAKWRNIQSISTKTGKNINVCTLSTNVQYNHLRSWPQQ